MKRIIFVSLLVSSFFASCTKDVLVGSGSVISEERVPGTFDKVHISGNREVEIIKSNQQRVEVSGYANLVREYDDKLSNGSLSFEYPALSRVRNDNVKLKIYTSDLSLITLSGNCKLQLGEGFNWEKLDFHLSGNARVESLNGTANKLRIDASGNPDIFLKQLMVNEADLHLSGNPEVEVNVKDALHLNASGSGRIKYWGSPASSVINVSGNVKVERQ
ncbi:MAG: DUF2807 domain-containing protein [Chitinophagaceae bacterium]|jgi:hypothetical protein|nr:DUF2807 domain-containing protein [Chitinophagaceae bacterium]